MTLHWWMHWFWITNLAVVLPALLLTATPIRTAPAPTAEFLSYSSPLPSYEEDFDAIHPEAEVLEAVTVDEEAGEEPLDDISWQQETLPDATIGEEIREPAREHHHVAPYGQLRNEEFTTYLPSPSPSTEEKQIRLADIYSVPTDGGRSITEDIPAVSGDGEQEQDFLTGVPSNGDVVESDSVGSEAEILPVPAVAQTTIVTPEDISIRESVQEPSLPPPAELETSSVPSVVSEGPSVAIGEAVVNSRSQGMDKPLVNVPHSITRDLKNSSVAPADTPVWQSDTESVAAAGEEGANGRLAKSALTLHSSLHESQYPPLSLDEEGHAGHSDRSAKAALVFHSPQLIAVATSTTVQPVTANEEIADGLLRSKDSADVSILPDSAGQTGSGVLQQLQEQATGEVDHPSDVLIHPSERPAVDGESEASKVKDDQESAVSSQKKIKVIPPLMSRTSANISTSQTGRVLTENGSNRGSGYTPPLITEPGVNVVSIVNVTGDPGVVSATTPAIIENKEATVSPSIISDDVNMVPTVLNDENETSIEVTAVPSVIPVSKGRVAAAIPTGSHSGLDAASITGISLGILVFAALVGAVSFVLYRRRFLNKPQTLNDKCSNPDSSGYIDDSTLRENSEEMYSLDNDSFLNSLEAMTIQNYWTDNVKHTKL